MLKPKVGLALGSGGARGFAHLGVLKVLTEAGIKIDYIAGSSMGALIGALYSVGHEYDILFKMATTFKRKFYLDFTVPKMGFISGKKLQSLIKAITHGKKIEECEPKLNIVATDLYTGERVVFKEGPIHQAVRASISIPGIFIPVKMGEKLLVDGGVTDRVPISILKNMGADFIIAVDVSSFTGGSEISSIYDVIMQSIDIMQKEMVNFQEIAADVMIRPNVMQFNSKAFTNMEEIIKMGEETARESLPQILHLLNQWKENNYDV